MQEPSSLRDVAGRCLRPAVFIVRMAWRDTRTSRHRLLLHAVSISLGIGAMVAIASLGDSLRRAVRQQSTALLGADLIARSSAPLSPEVQAALATLGGEQAREIGFSSMVLFPSGGRSRLVSVRAIEDAFPFYGSIETRPADAASTFRGRRAVLVEESLMLQFGAKVGDELRLGTQSFEIAGALIKVPGESPGFNLVAPRVYLPMQYLEQTQLVQRGSRLQHRVAIKAPLADVEAFRRAHRARFEQERVHLETVDGREAALGRTIANLERFLGLVALVALLLGAVGVASGVHVYVRQKLASIAVLRCIGATARQTFLVCLVQAAGLGLVGAVAGVALGISVQAVLPRLLGTLLPADVEWVVSVRAIAGGLAAGVGVTLALTLLPLLAARRVSPLIAIRSAVEPPRGSWRDPATLVVLALGVGAVTLVAVHQAASLRQGAAFIAGAAFIFGVLALIGRGAMMLARRLAPRATGYLWRQGVANLFRPNNRTLLLVVALGLGTALVATMLLTQRLLIGQLERSRAEGESNMILFDIQADQREAVRAVIEGQGLRVIDEAPVVSMRIASVKGRAVADLLEEGTGHRPPRWVLQREYRSTFRRALNDAERLVAGAFVPAVAPGAAPVPVSLEIDIARDLGVRVGDALTFDVQGVPVDCVVGSLREVETRRVRPFFFVVFPEGVLEAAPQFLILSTHVPDAPASGALQRELFERFPNVSVVDLTLILQTVDAVIDKAGFIFRFMAGFIVATGVVVLFGVMASGRLQRLRESVLLRTIGASRRQIMWIQAIEYWMLGSIAAFTGAGLAWCAAWGLGRWVFELRALPDVAPLIVLGLGVSAVTVLVGGVSGRRLLDQPPLELLRQEA